MNFDMRHHLSPSMHLAWLGLMEYMWNALEVAESEGSLIELARDDDTGFVYRIDDTFIGFTVSNGEIAICWTETEWENCLNVRK